MSEKDLNVNAGLRESSTFDLHSMQEIRRAADTGSDLEWQDSGRACLDGFLPSIADQANQVRNALPCWLRAAFGG